MSGKQRSYFKDLYELSTDRTLSLDEKIERAIAVGRNRLDLPYGVLSYTGAGEYEIVDSNIDTGPYVPGAVQNLDETWCRHVVDDRELLVIADVADSPFADDIARAVTGLQCYIGAPIIVDGEVYGTLCYSDEEPRAGDFEADEQRFVELLTRWISYEIERERHHRKLSEQNERLDEFTGVLAHDLRNPLTSAIGYTELALETAPDPITDHLELVADALDRMQSLITDTLSLAREGADVGERESLMLGAVARQAWETVDPADATLNVAEDRTIRADESRLRQLFENLFRNVEEHCGPGTTVTVRGTDDGFEVIDDGPGLPDAVADSVFGGSFGEKRPGLGLLIVERVVSGHGWTGKVETGAEGTKFRFNGVGVIADQAVPA